MEKVTLALAKGRLSEKAMGLMARAGIRSKEFDELGRKLVFEDDSGAYRFILVKPSDVPTYVDHGVADVGIVGKDTLMEENRPLYELLDFGFGACRMCVCGFEGRRPPVGAPLRVATKYPRIARAYYGEKGQNIQIIKLNGSVELGPLVGLSDVIVDIVESGGTLKANGLAVLEEVAPLSARLVVNRVSMKTKTEKIQRLIEGFKQALKEDEA
ncbi:ATP phosphoribosyltransferase [Gehongia tenuis]|uniref:ATP phosphoribosyltransferase n=1 Tax=Gehongia tenuis TaxID=2763655 RepID=A0A926HQ17_9FIRM|nr:ATP phosphoribosyltransferase [Gehongia tenuis]MBC8530781.1 ATP phosphoribosyltransferase [Gehongia tenuis]